ncbi:MAG: nicotinate (nicotinamide) nucleotide adenylyltransferase [Erysipelotrichales bacterium]|nr:nicotinate (nicotinamide) nucleotide adenylyltransferase [Erysipelotrichales bacterium]
MNIVFGGTFNPPTLAHEKMIDYLLLKFNPENLIIVPSGEYNHKESKKYSKHRLKMLYILAKERAKVKITAIELEKQFLGTFQTLKILEKDYPDIYFVLGSDNLASFEAWINFSRLIKEYRFIVFERKNYNAKRLISELYPNYQDRFTIIDFNIEISSSEVKRNLSKYRNFLNPDVYRYIEIHDLYKE